MGDRPDDVVENRRRLAADLGIGDASTMVWLHQVHGDTVVVADGGRTGMFSGMSMGMSTGTSKDAPEADAAVTDQLGVALVVQVADCAPIALVGDRAVGVVHAGWAG
ncbi:MAG: laccase domain-containing protein, partial [Acidimicrobiia bacterium]